MKLKPKFAFSSISCMWIILAFLCSRTVDSQDMSFLRNVDSAMDQVYRVEDNDSSFLGTAFTINPYGQLLTCAHVVGTRDTVVLVSYIEYEIEGQADTVLRRKTFSFRASVDTIIGRLDLAILNIDIEYYGIKNFAFFSFAQSKSLKEGVDIAICAFIPDAFTLPRPFLSRGIISTVRNKVYNTKLKSVVSIIQMDLNVSKGTSGGPIFFPESGRVVAIQNSAMFDFKSSKQSSYAMALTTDQLMAVLDSLNIPYNVR